MAKPHNFRVVHRYGVTTTPRVIQDLNTGRLHPLKQQTPHIAKAGGLTFHILKAHTGTSNHVVVKPYEGNWPRLSYYVKRGLELFA
ncbi:hypothetical protein HOT18_gp11 [Dickeya phage Ninurta]|uniref:Uncharacterized protein n=1 Tax=Dickeya phage Ninurta TaxID=2163631 RepID=A0A2S1GTA4_9CAUD|nr:hypothetical protein HOT18_gp11 [Dickeya phage Ninurta]AWD92630.1 hypothetical protein [Dickeya phage Ninurta]